MTIGSFQLLAPAGIATGTILTTPTGAQYKVSPGQTIGAVAADLSYLLTRGFTPAPANAGGTPYFMVNTPGSTSPVLGTALLIPYSNVATDPSNYWDATNFQWIPAVAGWYKCFMSLAFSTTASVANGTFSIQLRKNGSTILQNADALRETAALVNSCLYTAGLIQFNGTTDTLQGYGFFSNAAGVTGQAFGTSATNCFMGATFVSP